MGILLRYSTTSIQRTIQPLTAIEMLQTDYDINQYFLSFDRLATESLDLTRVAKEYQYSQQFGIESNSLTKFYNMSIGLEEDESDKQEKDPSLLRRIFEKAKKILTSIVDKLKQFGSYIMDRVKGMLKTFATKVGIVKEKVEGMSEEEKKHAEKTFNGTKMDEKTNPEDLAKQAVKDSNVKDKEKVESEVANKFKKIKDATSRIFTPNGKIKDIHKIKDSIASFVNEGSNLVIEAVKEFQQVGTKDRKFDDFIQGKLTKKNLKLSNEDLISCPFEKVVFNRIKTDDIISSFGFKGNLNFNEIEKWLSSYKQTYKDVEQYINNCDKNVKNNLSFVNQLHSKLSKDELARLGSANTIGMITTVAHVMSNISNILYVPINFMRWLADYLVEAYDICKLTFKV